jgi:hypothetical protein
VCSAVAADRREPGLARVPREQNQVENDSRKKNRNQGPELHPPITDHDDAAHGSGLRDSAAGLNRSTSWSGRATPRRKFSSILGLNRSASWAGPATPRQMTDSCENKRADRGRKCKQELVYSVEKMGEKTKEKQRNLCPDS